MPLRSGTLWPVPAAGAPRRAGGRTQSFPIRCSQHRRETPTPVPADLPDPVRDLQADETSSAPRIRNWSTRRGPHSSQAPAGASRALVAPITSRPRLTNPSLSTMAASRRKGTAQLSRSVIPHLPQNLPGPVHTISIRWQDTFPHNFQFWRTCRKVPRMPLICIANHGRLVAERIHERPVDGAIFTKVLPSRAVIATIPSSARAPSRTSASCDNPDSRY